MTPSRMTSCLLLGSALIAAAAGPLIALPGDSARTDDAERGGLGPPANLRCEYRVNPLGIDIAAPRLSWEVNDPRRGAVQTAYQIVVSTDPAMNEPEAVVWDTGKVESDRSIHVAYDGKPLRSGRRYYWTVRTFDAQGKPSPYSRPAWWEMGLLAPEDWSAKWITGEKPEELEPPMTWGD